MQPTARCWDDPVVLFGPQVPPFRESESACGEESWTPGLHKGVVGARLRPQALGFRGNSQHTLRHTAQPVDALAASRTCFAMGEVALAPSRPITELPTDLAESFKETFDLFDRENNGAKPGEVLRLVALEAAALDGLTPSYYCRNDRPQRFAHSPAVSWPTPN